jgi:dolichyl-phosphate-mannose--protein O-mannosyl transferase
MVIKFLKTNKYLVLILLLTVFLHFFRLDYPNAYVFDEVYHGFTAKDNPAARSCL